MPDDAGRFRERLANVVGDLKLRLSAAQTQRLETHYALLRQWNEHVNLTSVTDPAQAAQIHFGESLFVGTLLSSRHRTVVDIGSGAGFPGLPIAVLRPETKITLVEARSKKAAFLKEACRGLENVEVRNQRFEQIPERFDLAISRGVSLAPIWPDIQDKSSSLAVVVRGALELPNGVQDAAVKTFQLPWPDRGQVLWLDF